MPPLIKIGMPTMENDPAFQFDSAFLGPAVAVRNYGDRIVKRLGVLDAPRRGASPDALLAWGRGHAPVSKNEVLALVTLHGSVATRPVAAFAHEGLLGDGVLAELLPGVWGASDYPERLLTRTEWIELAAMAGYPGRPAKASWLYRGGTPDCLDTSTGVGMTWTRSPHRASQYAFARHRDGLIWRAYVQPARVLLASECGEACSFGEYVIDPQNLPGVDVWAEDQASRPGMWPGPRPKIRCLCSPLSQKFA